MYRLTILKYLFFHRFKKLFIFFNYCSIIQVLLLTILSSFHISSIDARFFRFNTMQVIRKFLVLQWPKHYQLLLHHFSEFSIFRFNYFLYKFTQNLFLWNNFRFAMSVDHCLKWGPQTLHHYLGLYIIFNTAIFKPGSKIFWVMYNRIVVHNHLRYISWCYFLSLAVVHF